MSSEPTPATVPTDVDAAAALRQAAVKRLKDKRDLQAHVIAYIMVNLFLVGIWALTTWPGFFWPAFVILGWGIGLVFHIWDVYSPEPSEGRIQAEIDRMRGT